MKTFAIALLFAAYTSAADLPDAVNDAPAPEDVEDAPVVEPEETDEEYWRKYKNFNLYGKAIWAGFFQGLYGSDADNKPTKDCFGNWIVDKLMDLSAFKQELRQSWMVDMDRAAQVSYDVVDLVFLNDKYCHFRQTIWDIKAFCGAEENCHGGDILDNLQKNAFPLITQISSTVSAFKEQPWSEKDDKHKALALMQVTMAVSGIFTDLMAFDPSKIPSADTTIVVDDDLALQ